MSAVCLSALSPLWPALLQALAQLSHVPARTPTQVYIQALILDYGIEKTAEIVVNKYCIVGSLEQIGAGED